MNISLWLSILFYAVQICRLYRFGIFRCNSLYYNGIKASRLHIRCSSGRKVGWSSEAFAWFFAAHSIAWTDHIPFDLCGQLQSAAEWKNEGTRVSGLDLGHTIADVKTTFSSEKPPISALYYSVSGLTTPHSIHTHHHRGSVRRCVRCLALMPARSGAAGHRAAQCGADRGWMRVWWWIKDQWVTISVFIIM